ncbi:MAG: amidohydrolase family protein [Chloroflexota bacterium]|nr:amidohydrolase family protein [Chloroflexota bacterium]
MIVDVHTHAPTHVSEVPDGEVRWEHVMRPDRPVRMSNSYTDYLKAMEPVDRAIVFGIAPQPGQNEVAGMSVREGNVNDDTARVVKAAPHKLIGFMSVHPDDPKALEEMDRAVHDLGLRGIKLGPNYQNFEPLGRSARRVYGRAQELGLPIVFHQGTSPVRDAPIRYAHPLLMDEIAMAFPELRIVMAHMGHPWQPDCIVVVRKHPNVYADVSGGFYRPWSFYGALRLAYEWKVVDKLLFASDWPVTDPRENVTALRNFNAIARQHHWPEVPDEALEGIIHRDSLTILGMK